MESLSSEVGEVKQKAIPQVDRVSISKMESEKVAAWVKQLESNSKGFLALTKSDVVNFLIREHKAELSPKEMGQIRSDHYDPIRHINWITQELKSALSTGDMSKVAALQEEIKGIELSVISHAKSILTTNETDSRDGLQSSIKMARKRKPKLDSVVPIESTTTADLQENTLQG